MKSWKTTLTAIFGIIVTILTQLSAMWDADPLTVANWNLVLPACIALFGLLFARDHKADPASVKTNQVYAEEDAA